MTTERTIHPIERWRYLEERDRLIPRRRRLIKVECRGCGRTVTRKRLVIAACPRCGYTGEEARA